MKKQLTNEEIEFSNKSMNLINEMIKDDSLEKEFICPICGDKAKVMRFNKKEYPGDFLSYCKECDKKARGRVFL